MTKTDVTVGCPRWFMYHAPKADICAQCEKNNGCDIRVVSQ